MKVTQTAAEKEVAQKERDKNKRTIKAALKAGRGKIYSIAQELFDEHQIRDVNWWYEALMQSSRRSKGARNINIWNAWVHMNRAPTGTS